MAIIRWPNWPAAFKGNDVIIALLYIDQQALTADHQRAAGWQRQRGAVASGHSLYLEKSPEGHAWINFGRRIYRAQSLAKKHGKVFEPPDARLAIPVIVGGQNRRAAINRTSEAGQMWVLFVCLRDFEMQTLIDAQQDLWHDRLAASPGTEPIPLSGLCTLGTLVLTESARRRKSERTTNK